MKFGLCLPNFGGKVGTDDMLRSATLAEESGFASVWTTDHIAVPKEHTDPYGDLLEPLVTLAYLAPRTSRVLLGTSVIVVPQRNPLLLGKQVAALDILSKGRVVLGAGAGWMAKEFGYLGAEFKERGRVFDESIALMRALWSDEVLDFSGKFFEVKGAVSFPKPGRPIPVWIAGSSGAAVRRAARIGDGWHPVGIPPSAVENGVRQIEKEGRKITISIRVSVDMRAKTPSVASAAGDRLVALSGSSAEMLGQVEEYRKAGVEHLAITLLSPDGPSLLEDVTRFSKDIVGSY